MVNDLENWIPQYLDGEYKKWTKDGPYLSRFGLCTANPASFISCCCSTFSLRLVVTGRPGPAISFGRVASLFTTNVVNSILGMVYH